MLHDRDRLPSVDAPAVCGATHGCVVATTRGPTCAVCGAPVELHGPPVRRRRESVIEDAPWLTPSRAAWSVN